VGGPSARHTRVLSGIISDSMSSVTFVKRTTVLLHIAKNWPEPQYWTVCIVSLSCKCHGVAGTVQREGGNGVWWLAVEERMVCEADPLRFLHDWGVYWGGVDESMFNRVNPPEGVVVSGRVPHLIY